MRVKANAFVMLLCLALLPLSAAQPTVIPDAEMECSPTAITIEVGPGDSRLGTFDCTVKNDSIYTEEVSIEATSDDLTVAAPGTITLGAQDETDLQIVIRGDDRMTKETRIVNVTYRVESANGSPCPEATCPEKFLELSVDIASFGWPSFDMVGQELTMEHSSTNEVNFTITNSGNDDDTLFISIENQSGLEEFGIIMKLSAESVRLEVNESRDIVLNLSTTEEVGDGSFEVKITVSSKRAQDDGNPIELTDQFALRTVAKTEILELSSVPTWALATVVLLLLLLVVGGVVVVSKVIGGKMRGELDHDLDDFEDELDLDDDFDDLDDFDLEDF